MNIRRTKPQTKFNVITNIGGGGDWGGGGERERKKGKKLR